MPTPMVKDILNNAVFHSSQRVNQTLHQILHICTFYSGLVAELCSRFCSQFDRGQGSSAATKLEVYRGDHDL